MQPIPFIVVLLAVLAYASTRFLNRLEPVRSERLKWWQKLAGIVAFVSVVLIAINPEFFALGLFGDTAFFDLLVLLISFNSPWLGPGVGVAQLVQNSGAGPLPRAHT